MKKATCKSCRYASVETDSQQIGKEVIICRRFPPTVFPIQTATKSVAQIVIWPAVSPETWCGEYVPTSVA